MTESRPPANCPFPLIPNEDRGWLGRPPTDDELDIVAWLERHGAPDRILHVGVGNSLLRERFGERVIQGITKDGAEALEAERRSFAVLVCNKYDISSYEKRLIRPFDCIVDVNLRSYACCDTHFQSYMAAMADSMRRNSS